MWTGQFPRFKTIADRGQHFWLYWASKVWLWRSPKRTLLVPVAHSRVVVANFVQLPIDPPRFTTGRPGGSAKNDQLAIDLEDHRVHSVNTHCKECFDCFIFLDIAQNLYHAQTREPFYQTRQTERVDSRGHHPNNHSSFQTEPQFKSIRVHRQAKFAQSTILCFQYLGFHGHTFNRGKLANYVIFPESTDSSNKCLAVCTVSIFVSRIPRQAAK